MYTRSSSTRYCRAKQISTKKCNENVNSEDCQRSFAGCKWYNDQCIDAKQCNELNDFSVCLNNTGILKDKCEWYTRSSSTRYCRDKTIVNFIDNCKDISYDDCRKGLNGCYWISEKCVLPTKCSDFNQTICQNINSYSSFRGTCEWNESTKKCQRIANLYGLCSENLEENDCNRSSLGCVWQNNKCITAHYCYLLSSSTCTNLLSNTMLRGYCEWNEITNNCQKISSIYGLCSDNTDENDCNRSNLGCAWVNDKCVNSFKCSLLSSSTCENLLSNTMLRGDCQWNESTKKCQRIANLYGLCSANLEENDCNRSSLGCVWQNNKCITAHYCYLLSSSTCTNLLSNTMLRGDCEWNEITNKCQKISSIYGLCSDNTDENDCSNSRLGCAWVNDKCITAHQCSLLSSSSCENLLSNTMLRGDCQWNKYDKICLQKKSIRLIRNLVEDEVTTK